jgi:hypothetical protein
MSTQTYATHIRRVVSYHIVLTALMLLGLVGSCVNLYQSIGDHQRLYSASLIVLVMVMLGMIAGFARVFPLKAQDRGIRAEENLRHFAMTGKLLDPRITIDQVIGLRFASDGEFVALARRAANEGLSQQDIKKAIRAWRPDEHRV